MQLSKSLYKGTAPRIMACNPKYAEVKVHEGASQPPTVHTQAIQYDQVHNTLLYKDSGIFLI